MKITTLPAAGPGLLAVNGMAITASASMGRVGKDSSGPQLSTSDLSMDQQDHPVGHDRIARRPARHQHGRRRM